MLRQLDVIQTLPFGPQSDPWDPIHVRKASGEHRLTSVEFTITNLCNMRCEHCAVGDALVTSEGTQIPLPRILDALDRVEHLQTISITGGEPSYRKDVIDNYVVPLLQYARSRGVYSQLNSNLTLERERYERIAPYLDVMHISFNYTNADDFHRIGFANQPHPVSFETAKRLYDRLIANAEYLSRNGLFVSAESMINYRTHEHIVDIHRLVAEMGCRRHELHPMYPSASAAHLPMLSLADMQRAIERLIRERDREVWLLFGTLPFYPCSSDPAERQLLSRMRREPLMTIRNDPDGRNRLNVNLFTGDVYVTDFADLPALGNVLHDPLEEVFARWLRHPLFRSVNCFCPEVDCAGPNLLVKNMYYKQEDFTQKRAILDL